MAEIGMVLRWWLVLVVLGAVATPLTWRLFGGMNGFGRIPTLGYAFAKPLGLLLVSYLFWILGSFGFLNNSVGGILFALGLTLALSIYVQRQRSQTISETVRKQWRYMLLIELLFLVALIFMAWWRAQNPQISNTEKPMEFAFLNAIHRTPSFPPLDPWLSGFAISYYYFGYIMVSVVARLAMVPQAFAFNLGTAWVFAGTITGAFGVVYNLIVLLGRRGDKKTRRQEEGETAQHASRITYYAALFALIGSLAIGLAGNLQIVWEVAHANGVGSAEFWQWLDITDINEPAIVAETARYEGSNWWWWRSSRLINEHNLAGTTDGMIEPIAEFPSLSFGLADLHPHVLALPFAFLSIMVALTWFLREVKEVGEIEGVGEVRLSGSLPHFSYFHTFFTVLIIGGLSFLNTWDVLIHLFIVVGAIGLARWRAAGRWSSDIVWTCLKWFGGFVGASYLLYLPFYIGFSSQAGAPFILPMLVRPTRLAHFLTFFGMPLLVIALLLAVLLVRQRLRGWKSGVAVAGGLVAALLVLMLLMGWLIGSSVQGASVLSNLASSLNIQLEASSGLGWSASAIGRILPTILSTRLQYAGVTLLLSFIIFACVAIAKETLDNRRQTTDDRPQTEKNKEQKSQTISLSPPLLVSPPSPTSPLPFLLLLILTAALLTIGPEYVYLSDQFAQRINTIFKFWYQAWVLFGLGAIVGLYLLFQQSRAVATVAGLGYIALLAGAMLFPYHMVQWGQAWYGAEPTLDGLAFVEQRNPDEYAAIQWLIDNTSADTPTILEAVGGAYTDYARVSTRTGLPTMLGWPGHQRQWRGNSTDEPGLREPIVAQIYGNKTWDNIPILLDQNNIDFIYVGRLERDAYGDAGIAKFDNQLEVAYQNDSVTIYAWD